MSQAVHTGPRRGESLLARFAGSWGDFASRPLSDYFMVLSLVWLLTGLGLTMVASSSMTTSALDTNSTWTFISKQLSMAVAGVLFFWLTLRTPLRLVRRYSGVLLVISALLLGAVLTPLGSGLEEVGSQSWLALGPIRFQPSELAKVAFAVWSASFLADVPGPKTPGMSQVRMRSLGIYGAVAAFFVGLIGLQRDWGMAGTFLIVVVLGLLLVGFHWAFFAGMGVVVVLGLGAILASGSYRAHRLLVFFNSIFGRFEDTRGTSYQLYQGILSLSEGSMFGVGLGQSRAKWYYLPEATNDFIFAVIGEELGLVGASFVIILFGMLGYFGFRTAARTKDRYLTLMAALLTGNVVFQALYNIAYVVGIAPVTGIQLPLISSGGTSIVVTLASLGLLANCARHEPDAVSAMATYGRPAMDRWFLLPEPAMTDVRGLPRVGESTPEHVKRDGRGGAAGRGRVTNERGERRQTRDPLRRQRRAASTPDKSSGSSFRNPGGTPPVSARRREYGEPGRGRSHGPSYGPSRGSGQPRVGGAEFRGYGRRGE